MDWTPAPSQISVNDTESDGPGSDAPTAVRPQRGKTGSPARHLRTVGKASPPWSDRPDLGAALSDACAGDEGAFRLLYRDMQPRLLRYLRALVGAEAEDVASETWLHVARDLHTFQGDTDGFRGWVTTIARHRATDHLRHARRRPPPLMVTAEDLESWAARDDTEARALESVSTDAAIGLICQLPRDQAEAVLLRVVVGLDAITAGKVLGKRPGAVRTASYRGLRRISGYLEEGGNAPGELPAMSVKRDVITRGSFWRDTGEPSDTRD
jgi:RNA polymerase sigma-70 factor (ECF subfamily)